MALSQFRIIDLLSVFSRLVLSVNAQGDRGIGTMVIVPDDLLDVPDREQRMMRLPEAQVVIGVDLSPGMVSDMVAGVTVYLRYADEVLTSRGAAMPELKALLDDLTSNRITLNRTQLLSPGLARRIDAILRSPGVQSVADAVERRFRTEHPQLYARLAAASDPNATGKLIQVRVRQEVMGQVAAHRTFGVSYRQLVELRRQNQTLSLRERLEMYRAGMEQLSQSRRARMESIRKITQHLTSREPQSPRISSPAQQAGARSPYAEELLRILQTERTLRRTEMQAQFAATARVVHAPSVKSDAPPEAVIPPDVDERLNTLLQVLGEETLHGMLAMERAMAYTAARIQAGEDISFSSFADMARDVLADIGSSFTDWSEQYLRQVYERIRQDPALFTSGQLSLVHSLSHADWQQHLVEGLLESPYHPMLVLLSLRDEQDSALQSAVRVIRALPEAQRILSELEREAHAVQQMASPGASGGEASHVYFSVSAPQADLSEHPVAVIREWAQQLQSEVMSAVAEDTWRMEARHWRAGDEIRMESQQSFLQRWYAQDIHRLAVLNAQTELGWQRMIQPTRAPSAPTSAYSARLYGGLGLVADLLAGSEQVRDVLMMSMALDRAMLELLVLRGQQEVDSEQAQQVVRFALKMYGVGGEYDTQDAVQHLLRLVEEAHLSDRPAVHLMYRGDRGQLLSWSSLWADDQLLRALRESPAWNPVALAWAMIQGVDYQTGAEQIRQRASAYDPDRAFIASIAQYLAHRKTEDQASVQQMLSLVLRHLDLPGDAGWRLRVLDQLTGGIWAASAPADRSSDEPTSTYTGSVVLLLPGGSPGDPGYASFGMRVFRARVRDFPLPEPPVQMRMEREPLHPGGLVDYGQQFSRLVAYVLSGNPAVLPERDFLRLLMVGLGVSSQMEAMSQLSVATTGAGDRRSSQDKHAVQSDVAEAGRSMLEFLFEAMDLDESDLEPEDPYQPNAQLMVEWDDALGITDEVAYRRRIGRGRSEWVLRGRRRIVRDVEPEVLLEYRATEADARARSLQAAMERLERRGEYTAVGPGGRLLQVLGLDVVDETGGVPVFTDRLLVRDWTLEEYLQRVVGQQAPLLPFSPEQLQMLVQQMVEAAQDTQTLHDLERSSAPTTVESAAHSMAYTDRATVVRALSRHLSLYSDETLLTAFREFHEGLSAVVEAHREHLEAISGAEERLRQMLDRSFTGEVELDWRNLYASLMEYRNAIRPEAEPSFREFTRQVWQLQSSLHTWLAQRLPVDALALDERDIRWLSRALISRLPQYLQSDLQESGYLFSRLLVRRAYRTLDEQMGLEQLTAQFLDEYLQSNNVISAHPGLLFTRMVLEFGRRFQLAQREQSGTVWRVSRTDAQAVARHLYRELSSRGVSLQLSERVAMQLFGVPMSQLASEGRSLQWTQLSLFPELAPPWQAPVQQTEAPPQPPQSPSADLQLPLDLYGAAAPPLAEPPPSYWSGHEQMLEALGLSAPEGLYGAKRRRFLTIFGWHSEMESLSRQSTREQVEQLDQLLASAFEGSISQRERAHLTALASMLDEYATGWQYLQQLDQRAVHDPSHFPVARALYHLIASDANTRLSVALRRTYLGSLARASGVETLQDLGAAVFAFAAEFVRTTPPGARIAELEGAIMPSDPDEVAEFLHRNLLRLMVAHALKRTSREQAEAEMRAVSLDAPLGEPDTPALIDLVTQSVTLQSGVEPITQEEVERQVDRMIARQQLHPPTPSTPALERTRPPLVDAAASSFREAAEKFDRMSRELYEQWRLRRAIEAEQSARERNRVRGTGLPYSMEDLRELLTPELLQRSLGKISVQRIQRLHRVLVGLSRSNAIDPGVASVDLPGQFRQFLKGEGVPEEMDSPMAREARRLAESMMAQYERELAEYERLKRDHEQRSGQRSGTTGKRTVKRTARVDVSAKLLNEEALKEQQARMDEQEAHQIDKRLHGASRGVRRNVVTPRYQQAPSKPSWRQFYDPRQETLAQFLRVVLGKERFLSLMEALDYRDAVDSDESVEAEVEHASPPPSATTTHYPPEAQPPSVTPPRQFGDIYREMIAEHVLSQPVRQAVEEMTRRFSGAYGYTLRWLRHISDVLTDLQEQRISREEAQRLLPRLTLLPGQHAVRTSIWYGQQEVPITVLPGGRVSVGGYVLSLTEGEAYTIAPEAVHTIPQQVERPVDLAQAMPAQVVVQPDRRGELRPAIQLLESIQGLQAAESTRYISFDIETDPRTGRLLQAGAVSYTYEGEGMDANVQALRVFLTDAELRAGARLEETKAYRQILSLIDILDTLQSEASLRRRVRAVAEALGMDPRVVSRAYRSSGSAEEFAINLVRSGALREESQVVREFAEYLLQQVEDGATPLVQNVAFDIPFIASRLEELGDAELAQRLRTAFPVHRMIDVAEMAVRAGHAQVSLQALGRETGVMAPGEREQHLALDDAMLAATVAGALQLEAQAEAPFEPIRPDQYLVGLGPGRLFDISGQVPEQVIGLRDRVFRVVGAGYSTDQNRVSVELEELAFDESGQPVPLRRLRFEPMMGDQEVHPLWQASLEMGRMFTVVDEEEARRVYQLAIGDAFRREVERVLSPDLPPGMTVRPGQLPSQYEREGIITSMMTVLRARAIAEGLPQRFSEPEEVAAWVREALGMSEGLSDELAVHLGQRAASYLSLQYARDPRRQEVYRRVWDWWNEQGRRETLGELMGMVLQHGMAKQLSWAEMTAIWRRMIASQVEEADLPQEAVETPRYREQVMHLNLALARGGFATIAVPTGVSETAQEAMILHRVRTQLRRQLLDSSFGSGATESSARADVAALTALSEAGELERVERAMQMMAQRRLIAHQVMDVQRRLEMESGDVAALERLRVVLEERSSELAREIGELVQPHQQRVAELLSMKPLQFAAELGRNRYLRETLDDYILRVALPVDTTAAERTHDANPDVWQAPDIASAGTAMHLLRSVMRQPDEPQPARVAVERLVPRAVSEEELLRISASALQELRATSVAERLRAMLEQRGVSGITITDRDIATWVPMHSAALALHRAVSEFAESGTPVQLSDVTERMRQLLGVDQLHIGRYHRLNLTVPTAAYDFVRYLMHSSGWIRRYADMIDEQWLDQMYEQMYRMRQAQFGRARAFASVTQPAAVEHPITTPFPEEYMEWIASAWREISGSDLMETPPRTEQTEQASSDQASSDQVSAGTGDFRSEGAEDQASDDASGVGSPLLLRSFSQSGGAGSSFSSGLLFVDDIVMLGLAAGAYVAHHLIRRRRERRQQQTSGGFTVPRGTSLVGSRRFTVYADNMSLTPAHHVRFSADYRRPGPYRRRRMERDMEALL